MRARVLGVLDRAVQAIVALVAAGTVRATWTWLGALVLSLAGLALALTACSPPTPTPSPTPTPDISQRAGYGVAAALRIRENVAFGADGLVLTFVRVTQDSRCPRSVTCVRAGDATVLLRWTDVRLGATGEVPVTVDEDGEGDAPFHEYRVTAFDLLPYPVAPAAIPPDGYTVVLRVAPLPPAPAPGQP